MRFDSNCVLRSLKHIEPIGGIVAFLRRMPVLGRVVSGSQWELFAKMNASGKEDLRRIRAIIHSMTPLERAAPQRISVSRRLRIARGSGTSSNQVRNLLREFQRLAS